MYHSSKDNSLSLVSNIGLTICLVLMVMLSALPQEITQADNSPEGISGQMGATKLQGIQPQLTYPENGWIDQNPTRGEAPGLSYQPMGYHQYPSSTYQSYPTSSYVGGDGLTLDAVKELTQQTSIETGHREISTEVSVVNFWYNPWRGTWMWGIAQADTNLTIQINSDVVATVGVDSNNEWGLEDPIEINPSDVITVTAGNGLEPVIISFPDQLTANADSETNKVWGQIGGRNEEWVNVNGWWEDGYRELVTDLYGNYLVIYDDVPKGAEGHIDFGFEEGTTWVGINAYFRTPDLIMGINYSHDWIDGDYPPGYSLKLTLTENDGVTVKATAEMVTSEIPWFNGGTGFSTSYENPWVPEQPNIQPFDWVYGEIDVDGTIYEAEVQIGLITGEVDVEADSITGTVEALWLMPGPIEVQCHAWGLGYWIEAKSDMVVPNGIDTYTCSWDPNTEWDVQPWQDIGVSYRVQDSHYIYGAFMGYSDEPILNIHYDHDWIDGSYKPGHTIYLEVKDGLGIEKAHITVESQVFEDGWSGFVSYQEGKYWSPRHPDIQPGDTIYAEVDEGEFTATVKIGEITALSDLVTDIVTGTVDADWLLPGPIDVGCYIWEENSVNIYTTVVPDGADNFSCDFSDEGWDLQPGTNLMVAYFEPDGHQVLGDFHPPAPYLRVQNWFIGDGSPGVGGNAAFYVEYANHGDFPAENVTITDTLVGLTYIRDTSGFDTSVVGNELTWEIGILEPGDWIKFVVFAEVAAPFDSPISNTVEITTNGPDMGEPWEKVSSWEGTVAANDTHLNVGKWPWTWNPAPGNDFVYTVNVCNNGSTSSSTVDLTEMLPANTTFGSWWGADVGWYETGQSGQILELSHTCISPGTCSEVYISVTLDPGAEPGDEIFNQVEIAAVNDMETDDNWASVTHHVGSPYTDLSIWQNWHWGSLVPGGYYRYGINFRNVGNLPVSSPIFITATLPAGTHLEGWEGWGWVDNDPVEVYDPVTNEVTWQVNGLHPGYDGTIEVWVVIDPGTTPGTVLEHLAEVDITDDYEDNNSHILTEMVNPHGPNLRVHKRGEWHGEPDDYYAWYELQVENIGDQTVQDVAITDIFPEGFALRDGPEVHFWEESECIDDSDGFVCTLDRLEPGWNIGVYFTLSPDSPDPGIIYTNTVTVASIERSDVNPDDNEATYELASGPDMFIEKTLVEGDFQPGTYVTYLLTFGNAQNTWWWGMQGNAVITDFLPEGMTFVSAYQRWCDGAEEWECVVTPTIENDGQTLIWELYQIGAGKWNQIRLLVEIDETVDTNNPLINQATIASDYPTVDIDPYPDNNSAFFDPELIGAFSIFLPLILR